MKNLKLMYVLGILMVISTLGWLAAVAVPFEPMTVYGYDPLPDEVCPNDPIVVIVDYSLSDINQEYWIKADSYWMPPGGGRPAGADSAEYPALPAERDSRLGVQVRSAPIEEGEWVLYTSYRVKGRIGFWPRTQLVEQESQDATHVLNIKDDRCYSSLNDLQQTISDS